MRSCKKYLLLLGLLLMAAVGGCGGIGYEETDENKPVTIKGPEGLPTNPKILIAYFSHTGNTELQRNRTFAGSAPGKFVCDFTGC